MSYTHLTIIQRNMIEILRKEKYSTRKIATLLGVHHSTIARELNRLVGLYSTILAQEHATKRNLKKGRSWKLQDKFSHIIQEHLKQTWPPEQIVGREFPKQLSVKTIYNWFHKGLLPIDRSILRRKGKLLKSKEIRGKFTIGRSIQERPKEVKQRSSFGHWELDTIVSSWGKSKGCFATFVERKTRFYIAFPIPDRSKQSMLHAIEQVISSFPKKSFQSFNFQSRKIVCLFSTGRTTWNFLLFCRFLLCMAKRE